MSEPRHAEIIGPFIAPEYSYIRVNGCRVPYLKVVRGTDAQDGKLEIVLDGRMSFIISDDDDTDTILSLVANAMAVAAGYPCMGATEKANPFNVKMVGIDLNPSSDV